MVQRRVADLGVLGEEIPGFPEKRSLRIEHRPDHPCVKIGEVRGGVFAYKLASVSGGPADH
jgi:hypothetical protein